MQGRVCGLVVRPPREQNGKLETIVVGVVFDVEIEVRRGEAEIVGTRHIGHNGEWLRWV